MVGRSRAGELPVLSGRHGEHPWRWTTEHSVYYHRQGHPGMQLGVRHEGVRFLHLLGSMYPDYERSHRKGHHRNDRDPKEPDPG